MNDRMTILTEERCNKEIADLYDRAKTLFGVVNAEKEFEKLAAKITIWQRVIFHLKAGNVLTLDKEDRFQLWEKVSNC